jgi:2-oxoglutarate ferredoxin oxidoreductase subunit alpha
LPAADLLARSDREGESGADVGFVAWGTAQGVVRETVALCQQFGLRVAALYPKTLWPVPTADLEDFGSALGSLVVVEPHRTGRYTGLVRTWTSLRCSTVWPEPGRALTPMDIFLREGLGT